MDWTESQLKAVEVRGRKTLVSAGAGSGKTRVLVERFLRLLETNRKWRIANIAAVTFTEKAAREMVSRIRREIRKRIESGEDPNEKQHWKAHRNALDSARVGTIHSLCTSILRAHPTEAGLSPAFKVLDEIDAAILLDRAIEEVLEETASPDALASTDFKLFAYLSPNTVRSALRIILSEGDRSRRAIDNIDATERQLVDRWRMLLSRFKSKAIQDLFARQSWKRDIAVIKQRHPLYSPDKREAVRAQVAKLIEEIEAVVDRTGSENTDIAAGLLADISSAIDLKGGSTAKWVNEADFTAVGAALRRVRETLKLEKWLKLCLNGYDLAAAPLVLALVRLAERAMERFQAVKRERSAVDFNDLEDLTGRLLASSPELRGVYTNSETGLIKALMIDEFQDTSPIQKRILWMLAPRSGELFIIGDAKQSIYQFRGADITVFEGVRAEFESGSPDSLAYANKKSGSTHIQDAAQWIPVSLPFDDPAGPLVVTLPECFRTHCGLVAFFNHVFQTILVKENEYDVSYEALRGIREPAGNRDAVEFHLLTQEAAKERFGVERLRELEARVIADRIVDIVSGERLPVFDDRERKWRPAEYGDIALLFQASTNFDLYEQALADRDIPYLTIAGRGFYNKQEITDLSNLLGFLSSPPDSLRLAAVLRSPMFGVSDESLLRLCSKERSLWQVLCDGSADVDEDQCALQFASRTLKRLLALVGRVPPGDLLSAALSETGYLATLVALPHGERRCANVEKLLEQAAALKSSTVSDFIERLAELKLREAREGEASIEEAGAVRVMTVHKAKGLEFPIVWIADASYTGFRDTSAIAIHPDLGFGINIRPEGPEPSRDVRRPAFLELIRSIEDKMDRAEKKRLLYVAATRARDHLAISGGIRGKAGGDNWLAWLSEALGLNETTGPESLRYPGGQASIHWYDAQQLYGEPMSAHRSNTNSGWERYESPGDTPIDRSRFKLLRALN